MIVALLRSLPRTLVLSSGAALVYLAACGLPRTERLPAGESTSRSAAALIAEPEHYVGAATMAPKQLALTFDDGPAERTAELSTYLKSENIRAVFFVNGARIQATQLPNVQGLTPLAGAAGILAQLTADGHLVGNHTTTHRDITTVPTGQLVQELAETDTLIRTHAGTPWSRSLFRAPFGAWNGDADYSTLQASAMKHYVGPIYWDVGGYSDRYPKAAADWACFGGELFQEGGGRVHSNLGDPIPDGYATTEECGNAYLSEIASVGRGVVLMHEPYGWAEGGSGGHTVDMVKYLVPKLKADGYTFVRADEVSIIAADFPACAAGCAMCSGPAPDQCTTCPAGSYAAGGTCAACTTCAAGSYASTPCTSAADTVCTPCADGTYAVAGATACISCAGCDDNDACTTDTCSPTAGCLHGAVPGCITSGSSGSTSSNGGTPGPQPPSNSGEDSGCSAAAGGTRTSPWALAIVALVLLRRRRRA